MSMLEPKRIDIISVNENSNMFWLTMIEERKWDEVDQEFKTLEKKLNFYIGATRDPTFYDQIPQAKGRTMGIRIYCQHEPDEAGLRALSLARAGCQHFGLIFKAFLFRDGEEVEEIRLPPAENGFINEPSSNN